MKRLLENISNFICVDKDSFKLDENNRYCVNYTVGGNRGDIIFSAPVANERGVIADLTSCNITADRMLMLNRATLVADTEGILLRDSESELLVSFCELGGRLIRPTQNGALCLLYSRDGSCQLRIKTDARGAETRANLRYFALMRSKFRPYFVISALCAQVGDGEFGGIVDMRYVERDGEYEIRFSCNSSASAVLIEINMYEEKFFLDTSVESKNPNMNNAFGVSALLGKSADLGETWLYTRPDFFKIERILRIPLKSVKLYLPCLFGTYTELELLPVSSRFCSFGSKWSNKKETLERSVTSSRCGNYACFDLSSLIIDSRGLLGRVDGFVIKTPAAKESAAMIATGDSNSFLQFLSIEYL